MKPGDSYANFRHEYWLDELAKPRTRATRLNVGGGVLGVAKSTAGGVVSMDRSANGRMDRCVAAMVKALEARRSARVSSVVTEFVMDEGGQVWIVRTMDCEVSAEPREAVEKNRGRGKRKEKRGEMYNLESKRLREDEEEVSVRRISEHE